MTHQFVDTDVLIRLLTGDDVEKQRAATALFEQVAAGAITIASPDTMIADAVVVLGSPRLYHLPRVQIRALRLPLVNLPHFHIANRHGLLRALDLYASTPLDCSDALIVAAMEQDGVDYLYSYDRHFDRIANIVRHEPPID